MITYDSLLVGATNGIFFENLDKDPEGSFQVLKALKPNQVNSLLLAMVVGYGKLYSYDGKKEDKEKINQLFAEDVNKLQEISVKIQLFQVLKGIDFVTAKSLEGLKELADEMQNQVIIDKAIFFSNMLVPILSKKKELENKLSTEAGGKITPSFAAATAATPKPSASTATTTLSASAKPPYTTGPK
jgi:hypothetical protein